MPLSWNEIRTRAVSFSKEWENETSESGEGQSFVNDFFNVFGRPRRRFAAFEYPITKANGKRGSIDVLWKGKLIMELKSRGKDLEKAYREQARDYMNGLTDEEMPRFVLTTDFANFHLYDMEENTEHKFKLADFHKNIKHFAFVAGYQTEKIKEQDPANIQAAELMGKLHDEMRENNYSGHDLEVYLVRLLFCMFAEDTGIFETGSFIRYIQNHTKQDGADLGAHLSQLFEILNTDNAQRQKNLDEQVNAFPYINGKLFEERLRPANFNARMRNALLECCNLDWSRISPAIFGSLFQSIMDKDARRDLGAHYTSETNILKLINPLFMDDLRAEFKKAKASKNKLFQFHKKLSALNFLDPACGCGNFLVVAYRELRLLELDVLRESLKHGQSHLDITNLINVNVDQFFGIELEEFPAQIAQVAMWLVDHQMNLLAEAEFGKYYVRIPLTTSAVIVNDNALRIRWQDVVPPFKLDYIMGNPPFVGRQFQSAEQKQELLSCYRHIRNAGIMDFVTAWYCKAVEYIAGTKIRCAFVSTNSVTQGEQVAPLWNELRARNHTEIQFAHRTFKWTNEASGKAVVSCVIIGFGEEKLKNPRLFDYEDIADVAHEIKAQNINPYLVDAPDVVVESRRTPICNVSPMVFGSMPNDGGNLLLDEDEKVYLTKQEPAAKRWIKKFLNADEFLRNKSRYCLWLVDCPPNELSKMPLVKARVAEVKKHRESSTRATTRNLGKTPTLFGEIRQSKSKYLLVPQVTTASRVYIPMGYVSPKVITGNLNQQVPNATLYEFGVLTSLMHMAWMRAVCGRMGNGYRYSANLVYNNYPWPKSPTEKQKTTIETCAQAVLDTRANFPDATFADLYNPLTMPPALQKAHARLDTAVDRAYRRNPFATEADRVSFLFALYQQYTAPLLPQDKKRRRRS